MLKVKLVRLCGPQQYKKYKYIEDKIYETPKRQILHMNSTTKTMFHISLFSKAEMFEMLKICFVIFNSN